MHVFDYVNPIELIFTSDRRKRENFKVKREELKYRNGNQSGLCDEKHAHCMSRRSV